VIFFEAVLTVSARLIKAKDNFRPAPAIPTTEAVTLKGSMLRERGGGHRRLRECEDRCKIKW
jgi:hypothetical protein